MIADSSKNCPANCCVLDPTPSGVMISHVHPKGQWMFSYRYMLMSMGGMRSGLGSINENKVFENYLMSSNYMSMDMHMFMAMYGVSDRLTLMGMLNYNVSSMNMIMLPGTTHLHRASMDMGNHKMDMTMRSSGIGDTKLYGMYGIINSPKHQMLFSLGLSIPTGSIQMKGDNNSMYPNQRLPYSMQNGSGTWDIMPGITWLYQKGPITLSTQATGTIRSWYNEVGYQLGNEASLNSWIAYQWHRSFSSSFRLEGSILGHINGYDPLLYALNEPPANPFNYGGKKISGFFGSNFHFRNGILKGNKIGAEIGLPVYQNLTGVQMALLASLFASWSIMF